LKNKIIVVILVLIALMVALQAGYAADVILQKNTLVKVYFSPKGGCTEAIINEINQAKSEIFVQAYSFTSAPIAKSLVDAHKRGVNVRVILDKSQRKGKYTSATFLYNAGIPTYIDSKHAIAQQNHDY